MRGKILSILLVAVFFSALLPMSFAAVTSTVIKIDPSAIYGHVGDYFTVDVVIEKAKDVYAWEVKIQYPPYRSVLVPQGVVDGGFLSGNVYFVWDDSPFTGVLSIGSTLFGDVPGVSGSGVLCTITFYVMEAGEGPIEFISSALVERVGTEIYDIDHQTRDAYFFGPIATLVRIELLPGRALEKEEQAEFYTKVRNDYDVPLYIRTTLEITRLEDGYYQELSSGQWWFGLGELPPPTWLDPLYVDGYYPAWERWTYPDAWSKVGTDPWLDAVDYPANYIWCAGVNGPITAAYTFEDVTIGSQFDLTDVVLEGYTNSDEFWIDLDTYTWAPTAFDWLGSLWGTTTWDWHTPRWLNPGESVYTILSDTLGRPMNNQDLNDMEVLLYHYTGGGPIGTMMCDALRLQVQIAWKTLDPLVPETYVVNPGGTLELPVISIGPLNIEDAGTYAVTARAWYSFTGAWFNPSPAKTLTYKVAA